MSPHSDALLRVNRRHHCPVCDKPDWCLAAEDDSRAICQRVESDRRVGEAGWLHVLDGSRRSAPHSPTVRIEHRRGDFGLYEANAVGFRRSDGLDGVFRLQNQLGVSIASLERLGVGHNGWAWTFPMRSPSGRIVGIRLRKPDGSKLAVRGSQQGLFIPSGLTGSGPLLIAEGPTDTGAALDLGFDAIGRPSCEGCLGWTVAFVRERLCRDVVVVSDSDAPGRAGAARLASALCLYAPVRVIEPPEGVKDLREWKRKGCTPQALESAISAAPRIRARVEVAR